MSKEPIVVTSPWGDAEGNASPSDRHSHDRFYVHGYSDIRQDREQERAKGERTSPLPYRFQYVSVERSNGMPFGDKVADFKGRGYTTVMYDDCAQYGIDPAKSAFIKGPDGSCRQGSQILMVAPKEAAARDYRLQQERNAALQGAYKNMADQAAADFNERHPGYEKTSFEFEERTDGKPFEFEKKMKK